MNKYLPKLATKKQCTGCLACIDSCKSGAIEYYVQNGLRYIRVNNTLCIGCGMCEKTCPIITPVTNNNIKDIKVFGGWSKTDAVRLHSASGGAFAEHALSFIKDGGYVAGACLIDNKVKHIIINETKDLVKLQNSKYLQSNTSGIYRQVQKLLNENKPVLFSGTPCQIAGLYGYLGNKKTTTLFTIELVCHGIPSDEILAYHLQSNKSNEIISFREKSEGWVASHSQLTTIKVLDDLNQGLQVKCSKDNDYFYKAFSCGLTERRSCYECKFSTLPRMSDITLADFWGCKQYPEEQHKGISLIITNNSKGEEILSKTAGLFTFKSSLIECIGSNPRIYNGSKYIRYHPMVLTKQLLYNILPYKVKWAILTNGYPYRFLWGYYRIIDKIIEKQKFQQVKETIKKNSL